MKHSTMQSMSRCKTKSKRAKVSVKSNFIVNDVVFLNDLTSNIYKTGWHGGAAVNAAAS